MKKKQNQKKQHPKKNLEGSEKVEKKKNNLKFIRQNLGYTQKYFSELVGISIPTLKKFENGEYVYIKYQYKQNIAKILNLSINVIFPYDSFLNQSDKDLQFENTCLELENNSICYRKSKNKLNN